MGDEKKQEPQDFNKAGHRGAPDPPCCPDPQPRLPLEPRRFTVDVAVRERLPATKMFLTQGRKKPSTS